MGIPVNVFYPINNEPAHASDREQFSSFQNIVRIYRFDEIESANWNPETIDVSEIKLQILDRFYKMAARWQITQRPEIGFIAPPSILPKVIFVNGKPKVSGLYAGFLIRQPDFVNL